MMNFPEFCKLLFEIESSPARLEKTAKLAHIWKSLTPEEAKLTAYLLLGRVGPEYDSSEIGLAEKQILKCIALAFHLDGAKIEDEFVKIGDLGELASSIVYNNDDLFASQSQSIKEIFSRLQAMSNLSGKGSSNSKLATMVSLLTQASPIERRYIARLPTGNLRLGFSQMTVIDSLSWLLAGDKSLATSIESAFLVRPDLGELASLCVELFGNSQSPQAIHTALTKVTPRLFVPIRMMRAQRASSGEEILSHSSEVLVEPKYDGLRLQVHLDKSIQKYQIFSRGMENVSDMYTDVGSNLLQALETNSAIVEGEAVGFDPKTEKLLDFQSTVKRKRKYDVEQMSEDIPLRFHLFDILLLDNEPVLSRPFSQRRKLLSEKIKANGKTIVDAPEILRSDPKLIESDFDEAIASGLEGIIAKIPSDPYRAGARGWSWMKLKGSYSEKMNDTIDALIMGIDEGKGKRTGFGAGAFLVGVWNEKTEKFETIAKIGTGLTDEEWKQIATLAKAHEVKTTPTEYVIDKMMACHTYLTPSVVVEIRADEVTSSQMHTAGREITTSDKGVQNVVKSGFALRFPRLERFRDDKKPSDITTVSELEQIAKKLKIS